MRQIREHLEQMKKDLENHTIYKEGLPGSALDIVNTLLNDLEQDEKENGWIPVKYHQISEKEREEESISRDIICLTAKCQMMDKKYWLLMENQHGKIQALLIVTDIILIAIMIGLRLRHGDHYQNHITSSVMPVPLRRYAENILIGAITIQKTGQKWRCHMSKAYKDPTADEAIFQMSDDSEVEV